MKDKDEKKDNKDKSRDIIAHRRSCVVNGTGLSHFILVQKNGEIK